HRPELGNACCRRGVTSGELAEGFKLVGRQRLAHRGKQQRPPSSPCLAAERGAEQGFVLKCSAERKLRLHRRPPSNPLGPGFADLKISASSTITSSALWASSSSAVRRSSLKLAASACSSTASMAEGRCFIAQRHASVLSLNAGRGMKTSASR